MDLIHFNFLFQENGNGKWKTNISNIRNINFKNKKYNVNI